jgi:serine/threonine protein kinase
MPEIGQRIGPYVLEEWISSDPETSLYRAVGPEGGRLPKYAAVRLPNIAQDERSIRLVAHEHHCRSLFQSEYLPEVLAYYPEQGALVTEWLNGKLLSHTIAARNRGELELSPATAMTIAVEVAVAMRKMHLHKVGRHPLVYGRLNPDHLIIDGYGDVYLLGLGRDPFRNQPAFSPPEQSSNAFVDWRSDQWAIGALLVELLLHEPLYSNTEDPVKASMRGETLHWIKQIDQRWHKAGAVLARILAPAAGNRYQKEEVFIRDLIELAESAEGDDGIEGIAEATGSIEMDVTKPIIRDVGQASSRPRPPTKPQPVKPPSRRLKTPAKPIRHSMEDELAPNFSIGKENNQPVHKTSITIESEMEFERLEPTLDVSPMEDVFTDEFDVGPVVQLQMTERITMTLVIINAIAIVCAIYYGIGG